MTQQPTGPLPDPPTLTGAQLRPWYLVRGKPLTSRCALCRQAISPRGMHYQLLGPDDHDWANASMHPRCAHHTQKTNPDMQLIYREGR